MPWWGWAGILVVTYLAWAFFTRHRNRRVHATIVVQERGLPLVQLGPPDASPEDLALAALCYLAKVWWLVQSEFAVSRDILRELIAEAIGFWDHETGDLIDRMPTASTIRADQEHPMAVSGGERFEISYYRTRYKTLKNRGHVRNTLPAPGLAANVPWSASSC